MHKTEQKTSYLDFTEDPLCINKIYKSVFHFLNSNSSARYIVLAGTNTPHRSYTGTYRLQPSVALVDAEFFVFDSVFLRTTAVVII